MHWRIFYFMWLRLIYEFFGVHSNPIWKGRNCRLYRSSHLKFHEYFRNFGIFKNFCTKEGDKKQIDYLCRFSDWLHVGHFQDHTFFVVVRSIDYFYIVEVECVILVPRMFGESGPFFREVIHIFLCSWILVFRGRFDVPM